MKKILIWGLLLILITACSYNSMAIMAVKDYLDDYINFNNNVEESMNKYVEGENISEEQKKIYKEILERQYRNLNYEIINESYEDNKAIIGVKVTVYNLYKVQKDADDYLVNHEEEFYTKGVYDKDKFILYKLNLMKQTDERITYLIDFKVNKIENKWIVDQPSNSDLDKIHGTFEY